MLPATKQRERNRILTLFGQMKSHLIEITIYQSKDEIANLWSAVDSINEVPGEMAEVGVFEGGTAKLILETNKEKELYLFDTFAGLPGKDLVKGLDCKEYKGGVCAADVKVAKKFLKDYSRAHIYKGRFPDTAGPIKDKRFAFVHLDVDIYVATKESLEFFYPRMNKGGKILVHDYPVLPGLKKAVDELKMPEEAERIDTAQGLITKL